MVSRTLPPRRLPTPWRVVELPDSFVVHDDLGQPLAYIYFEDEPARQSLLKRLSRDDARWIAASIAKLPKLLQR